MNAIVRVGKGDLAQGIINAFKQGLIDVPFAPSEMNKGLILPARDIEGKIRILEFGQLAFSEDTKIFHQEKLALRAKKQHRDLSIQMVIDDIYAVSSGKLVGDKEEVPDEN